MNKYLVSVPFTGYFTVEVEAEDERAAIDLAFETELFDKNTDIGEIEYHRHVTRGNVCSAVLNDLEIEKL